LRSRGDALEEGDAVVDGGVCDGVGNGFDGLPHAASRVRVASAGTTANLCFQAISRVPHRPLKSGFNSAERGLIALLSSHPLCMGVSTDDL
jgi:hypothetical protein